MRIFGANVPLSKETLAIIVGVVLAFMLINFNEKLGTVFGFLVFLDTIIILLAKNINFFGPEKDTIRFKDLVLGLFGYAVFVTVAAILGSVFIGGAALNQPLQAVFMKLQATQPVLEGNSILTFIGWGILIPIVETGFFFGRLMQWLAAKFNTGVELTKARSWLVFIMISAGFALFHLTARAIAVTSTGIVFDNFALMLTFLFGIISCVLVAYSKELSSATYMHIISNSLAVAGTLGIGITAALLGV